MTSMTSTALVVLVVCCVTWPSAALSDESHVGATESNTAVTTTSVPSSTATSITSTVSTASTTNTSQTANYTTTSNTTQTPETISTTSTTTTPTPKPTTSNPTTTPQSTSTPALTTTSSEPSTTGGESTTTTSTTTSTTTPTTTPTTPTTANNSASPPTPTNTSSTNSPNTTTTTPTQNTTTSEPSTQHPKSSSTNSSPAGTSEATSVSTSVSTSRSTSVLPPETTSSPALPNSTASTKTPTLPDNGVRISETNILLTDDTSQMFVELTGKSGDELDGLALVIKDSYRDTTLDLVRLEGRLDNTGHHVLEEGRPLNLSQSLSGVESVMLGLYQSVETANISGLPGLLDVVVYAIRPESTWLNSPVQENFDMKGKNQIILISEDCRKSFKVDHAVSLSRCSTADANAHNAGMALTISSKQKANDCDLKFKTVLEMKLTHRSPKCDVDVLAPNFNDTLTSEIVKGVNQMRQCGLTWIMLKDMTVERNCNKQGITEIPVTFTLHAAFATQLNNIKDTYVSFVLENRQLPISNRNYEVSNCTDGCFDNVLPAHEDDKSIQVTYAVVISCIAVFIVVLGAVILYMKHKRRGILQFRMTRLDEDDDDLIGDMDDFIGESGPTFRRYR